MGYRLPSLIALLLVACTTYPPDIPRPPRPDPVRDADCRKVCDNFRELGCDAAEVAADGSTCEEVCEVGAQWYDMPCLAGMTTCEQQEACVVGE